MFYRIDILRPPDDVLDRLMRLGAIDVEAVAERVAALLPDSVQQEAVLREFGWDRVRFSAAVARDSGSVWLLHPGPVRTGRILITASGAGAPSDAVQLIDSPAFGSGHHPTTALCLEVLDEELAAEPVGSLLDVGTGSGILALAALRLGVRRAAGIDIDRTALKVAYRNAQLNGLTDRLELVCGGPEAIEGQWPLVVANVVAAPLMELAPAIVRSVSSRGRLILSGIRRSLSDEVQQPYRHLGMQVVDQRVRAGWTALMLRASW